MIKELKGEILKVITKTSGLNGLTTINLNEASYSLLENKWEDSIKIEETNKGIIVSLGIIVMIEVRAKVVSYEISSTIKTICKNKQIKLAKVNIYIRGVK